MRPLWISVAAGAALAALALLAILRRPAAARPVPATPTTEPPGPASPAPRTSEPRVAIGKLLTDLAVALRDGEQDAAERLIAELAPPVPDNQNAAVLDSQASI